MNYVKPMFRVACSAMNDLAKRRARQDDVLATLALMLETSGAAHVLRRRMLSVAAGNDQSTLKPDAKSDLSKIFSPKRGRTPAGRSAMRTAAARLILDLGGIESGAANVITAQVLAADAGYDGPLGSGREAGFLMETEPHQGVDPQDGYAYAIRHKVMIQAGYSFGVKGLLDDPRDIPPIRWTEVTAWMRRQHKLKPASPDTIQDWAQDDSAESTERGFSLRGTFLQARQEGAADKAAGRVNPNRTLRKAVPLK